MWNNCGYCDKATQTDPIPPRRPLRQPHPPLKSPISIKIPSHSEKIPVVLTSVGHRRSSNIRRTDNDSFFQRPWYKHMVTDGECLCYRRLFWILAMMGLLAVVSVLVYELMRNYISTPIIVWVDNVERNLKGEPFPAVTICNFNWQIELEMENTMASLHKHDVTWNLSSSAAYVTDDKTSFDPLSTDVKQFKSLFLAKYEQSGMILNCSWRTTERNCSEIFTSVITDMGLCSSFNMYDLIDNPNDTSEKFTIEGVSERNGLGVLLNAQTDRGVDKDDLFFPVGFKVMIHSPSEVPLESKAFLIGPGTMVNAAVSVIKTDTTNSVMRQWPAYNEKNCITPEESNLQKHFKVYSQNNCFMDCVRQQIAKNCTCNMPNTLYTYKVYVGLPNCLRDTVLRHCASNLVDSLQRSDSCSCPRPCDETVYEPSISAARYPGNRALEKLSQTYKKDKSYIKENFVYLQVFLDDLMYMKYTRDVSSSTAQLLGNFGGIIGCILGASLLTFVHVVYFVIHRLFPCK